MWLKKIEMWMKSGIKVREADRIIYTAYRVVPGFCAVYRGPLFSAAPSVPKYYTDLLGNYVAV